MSSVSCHSSPSLIKTSQKWSCVIISFSAASFPQPLKALTVSHPVNECNLRREARTWTRAADTLEMLIYLVRVAVPHFTYTLLCIFLGKTRQRRMMSVSSATMIMDDTLGASCFT